MTEHEEVALFEVAHRVIIAICHAESRALVELITIKDWRILIQVRRALLKAPMVTSHSATYIHI